MTAPTNAELTAQVNQLQEKLYDNGVEKRPSIMSEIEVIEEETGRKLAEFQLKYEKRQVKFNDQFNNDQKAIINSCEKETGRKFMFSHSYFPSIVPIKNAQLASQYDLSFQQDVPESYDWKNALRQFKQCNSTQINEQLAFMINAIINEKY